MAAMKLSRTQIAAGGTTVALGALAAVALGAGARENIKTVTVPAKVPAAEVRTVVVHRTVRVVKHEKPKTPKPAPVATPPVPAPQPRVIQVAQTQPAPAYKPASKPLTTKASGGSSGGGEHGDDGEHEGGGEDD
jgi:outer membrane biosynthesis protein TonB